MLPDISHLQFFVLAALMNGGELYGRELRDRLRQEGVKRSRAAFYQLMSRLEEADLVTGRYREQSIEGIKIRQRSYRISVDGCGVVNNVIDFYNNQIHLSLE